MKKFKNLELKGSQPALVRVMEPDDLLSFFFAVAAHLINKKTNVCKNNYAMCTKHGLLSPKSSKISINNTTHAGKLLLSTSGSNRCMQLSWTDKNLTTACTAKIQSK